MPSDDRPVAIFDSGVGGLPYLAAARQRMPEEWFVYLADRSGFPYGTKSPSEVIELATTAVSLLIKKTNPKAVLVACNTATELAIDQIRKANTHIPVIGTVPAIKLAAALTKKYRIGIVATPAAARAEYLDNLTSAFASGCAVRKIGDGALVDFVETRFLVSTREERLEAVRPSVNAMLEAGVDAIVLGCTHFVHLLAEFRELAGSGVSIVDSREGVVKRLDTVLKNSRHTGSPVAEDCLYLTGDGEPGTVHAGFASLFALRFAGTLP